MRETRIEKEVGNCATNLANQKKKELEKFL
jgi:hypothetical protein